MADSITIGDAATQAPPSRFHGLRAAGQSFAFVFVNAGAAARTASGWTIALAVLLVGCALIWNERSDVRLIVGSLLGLAALIGFPIACALIAVAWHRFVLRGEPSPRLPLALAPALRYLMLVIFSIVAVIILPSAAAGTALDNFAASGWSASFILGTAAIAALAVLGAMLRFSFTLPALALGDDGMTLRRSWRETKHMWRGLLRATVIVALPAGFALILGVAAGIYVPSGTTAALVLVAVIATTFVFVMVYVTFLSLAYRATVASADRISETFA